MTLRLGSNVNFIFECDSLQFASPATVSRTAMIFLSEEAVDPTLIVKGWVAKQPEDLRVRLEGWCNDHFFKALDRAMGLAAATRTTKVGGLLGLTITLNGAQLTFRLDSHMDTNSLCGVNHIVRVCPSARLWFSCIHCRSIHCSP